MMKAVLGCGGAISMLVLAACGGRIQDIGDAAGDGGSVGEPVEGSALEPRGGSAPEPRGGSTASASGSAPSQGGGMTSGRADAGGSSGAWAPGSCDPPCREGFGCYPIADDPSGLCAPLCDTPGQGQTPDADLSCSNSVRGGVGQCVFSVGFGWPLPFGMMSRMPASDGVVTGLCSNACDPLAQDCPTGYKCDLTEIYSAAEQHELYACMPNKAPLAQGEACDSVGDGMCDAGLTCAFPDAARPSESTCQALCDLRDPRTCPAGQLCTEELVTRKDNEPNIGVCL